MFLEFPLFNVDSRRNENMKKRFWLGKMSLASEFSQSKFMKKTVF